MKAADELRRSGAELTERPVCDAAEEFDVLRAITSNQSSMADRPFAATSVYRPRFYGGTITLIAPSNNRRLGCDPARLWKRYAAHLVVHRVAGDHATVIHEHASAIAVSGVIDHQLVLARERSARLTPMLGFERPLIVTTMRWFGAARLAHSLIQAGFSVSACRPPRHALGTVDGLATDFRINRLWRRRSLLAAIRRSEPDIILPDDERAVVLLRQLHSLGRRPIRRMASLIARSLGSPAVWSSLISRSALASEARALGIAVPATAVVRTQRDPGILG